MMVRADPNRNNHGAIYVQTRAPTIHVEQILSIMSKIMDNTK